MPSSSRQRPSVAGPAWAVADFRPTARTRLAAVIGSPIGHSRSPAIANAAFRTSGLDWTFVAFDVGQGKGPEAVDAARTLGVGGLMVTMPHKGAVIAALDRLTPGADALDAVNSIYWDGDDLVGDNTDGPGLVASLRADGVDVSGRRCVVFGAGGAARSIVWALADAGATSVEVVNRTTAKADAAASLAGEVGSVAGPDAVGEADIVVNATSVGMGADPADQSAIPLDPQLLHEGQIVVDAVYQPLRTALLQAAEQRGARTIDGLGMLVHQAAISIERWTGVSPDLEVMTEAARD